MKSSPDIASKGTDKASEPENRWQD